MLGTISPDVARAAVGLRRSHPAVSALEVLDVVMLQRGGSLKDFGPALDPGSPFSLLVAEAFDKGMAPADWQMLASPSCDPRIAAALRQVWTTEVLPAFARRYSLTI